METINPDNPDAPDQPPMHDKAGGFTAPEPLDITAMIAGARASVDHLEHKVETDKALEKRATETRRKTEADLKEAKRILHALTGSPLKGTKRPKTPVSNPK